MCQICRIRIAGRRNTWTSLINQLPFESQFTFPASNCKTLLLTQTFRFEKLQFFFFSDCSVSFLAKSQRVKTHGIHLYFLLRLLYVSLMVTASLHSLVPLFSHPSHHFSSHMYFVCITLIHGFSNNWLAVHFVISLPTSYSHDCAPKFIIGKITLTLYSVQWLYILS